ncbi:MAG: hypothetical protein U5L45_06870 [Saprospiraceae bacterium]|nr:hypothetical protein [Saprospiraceae bacterium]
MKSLENTPFSRLLLVYTEGSLFKQLLRFCNYLVETHLVAFCERSDAVGSIFELFFIKRYFISIGIISNLL